MPVQVTTREINQRARSLEQQTTKMFPGGPIARQAMERGMPRHFAGVPLYEVKRANEVQIYPPIKLPGYQLLSAKENQHAV